MNPTPTQQQAITIPRDVAADIIHRLETMQPPDVVLKQITMLGEVATLLRAALAAHPDPQPQGAGVSYLPPAGEAQAWLEFAFPGGTYTSTSMKTAYVAGWQSAIGVRPPNPLPEPLKEALRKAYEPDDYEDAFPRETPPPEPVSEGVTEAAEYLVSRAYEIWSAKDAPISADVPRSVLLDKTLRQYAHERLIEACGAWSDVRNLNGEINAAKCQLAAAHEGQLRGAIDELADLSNALIAERDGLQKSLDELHGAKFSDRCYHALKDRAERAEAERDGLKAEVERLTDENTGLLGLTLDLDEHPDDYDGPCMCKTCQSYADVDEGAQQEKG